MPHRRTTKITATINSIVYFPNSWLLPQAHFPRSIPGLIPADGGRTRFHTESTYALRNVRITWPELPQAAQILWELACVASVSNRVTARKLEREQKKKVEGGGRGEKRKRLPANPTILKNAPWYFTVRFICKLTARQNRNITNRLPLDYQICKITLFSNRTRSRRLQKL